MIILQFLLNKFITKPLGLLFATFSAILFCVNLLPKTGDNYTPFIATAITCFFIIIGYATVLIAINTLPRARKNQIGVLFIIHAENSTIYKEAKFNLVDNFNNIVNKFDTNFTAICLAAETIKGYNLGNKNGIQKLLETTNCFFSVDIVYQVDSVSNTSNYQLKINTETINPRLSTNFIAILRGELRKVSEPIKNLKFSKDKKLERLDITAEQLSYIVKYILGLTLFLGHNYSYAVMLFDELYKTGIADVLPNLALSFCKLYYNVCFAFETECFEKFHDTQDYSNLDVAENYLNRMNELIPNTYGYNLDMASLRFLKYRDVQTSIAHINECRKKNTRNEWKYSEAFLVAYASEDVNKICKKYEAAIKTDYNIIHIIAYIENVLEKEPEKHNLNLALSMLYNSRGDKALAASHLKSFLNNYELQPTDKVCKRFVDTVNPICIDCKSISKCFSCQKIAS